MYSHKTQNWTFDLKAHSHKKIQISQLYFTPTCDNFLFIISVHCFLYHYCYSCYVNFPLLIELERLLKLISYCYSNCHCCQKINILNSVFWLKLRVYHWPNVLDFLKKWNRLNITWAEKHIVKYNMIQSDKGHIK